MSARAIATGEVQVWLADPADLPAPVAARLAGEILSPDERERMRRYIFAGDRRLHLVARLLVRLALSAAEPSVAPAGWRFDTGVHGRPELAPPFDDLRFNLSHTDGLVACALARDLEVGIDVERLTGRDVERLVEHTLSRAERAHLARLPVAARPHEFLRYWTVKEAYAKARGLGLTLPLDACEFALAGSDAVLLRHPPDPVAGTWLFRLARPTPRHQLALAVRHTGSGPVRVVVHNECRW